MIEQKRKIFEETLTSKFDSNQYVLFLRELLHNVQLIAPGVKKQPFNTFSAAIDHYFHIGQYTGSDGNRVALFSVCLKKEDNIQNARSGILSRHFWAAALGRLWLFIPKMNLKNGVFLWSAWIMNFPKARSARN